MTARSRWQCRITPIRHPINIRPRQQRGTIAIGCVTAFLPGARSPPARSARQAGPGGSLAASATGTVGTQPSLRYRGRVA
jgi:hypothetical protein